MSMQCSVCGRPVSEDIKKCICGYDIEGWSLLMELDKTDNEKADLRDSKMTLKFNDNELKGIVDLINIKLKE